MREIKFRAWASYGEMLTNVQNHIGNGPWAFGTMLAKPDEFSIMQFTGLKDKNGVEIYEGDIVKMFYQDWLDKTEVIKFKDGTFGYGGEFHFSPFHCLAQDMRDARYHFSHAFEVIGNIYQNPEMLK